MGGIILYVVQNKVTKKYLSINKHSPNVWSRDIEYATKFYSLQGACEALNLYYGEPVEIVII